MTALPISIGWIVFGASIGRYMTEGGRVLLSRITATILTAFACGMIASVFFLTTLGR